MNQARAPQYQFKGGGFVPYVDEDGSTFESPAAVNLIEHYHRGADGGIQTFICGDPVLRGPEEAAPRTLDTIVTTEAYAVIATTYTRLVVNHMAAALFAAENGGAAADAEQEFADVEDEEEDDSDDDE